MKAFFALFAILLLSAPRASATSFNPQKFQDTVKNAPMIAHGTIGGASAEWFTGPDGVKRLYTYYELQVTEALKGSLSGSIQFRELGGEKDGVVLHFDGAARFDKGEDVIVTLGNRNSDGSYDLQGMSTGKFALHDDSEKKYITVPTFDSEGDPVPGGEKWTIEGLKTLVAEQEMRPNPQPSKSGPHATGAQPSSPVGLASSKSAPSLAPTSTPTLQGEKAETSTHLLAFPLAWIAGGALILFLLLRRLRRGRGNTKLKP